MLKYPAVLVLSLLLFSCVPSQANAAEEAKFYDPIEKQVEGWKVNVDPTLLTKEHEELTGRVFMALANHLQCVKFILPADRVEKLQTLPIWLELHNEKLSSMQYHPDRGWLLANGHDPRLAKHVHIPRAKDLLAAHTWAKHPYVVLHELAHAYHDQVLSFDHPEVLAAFNAAKAKGGYEEVLLYTGKKVRHYGMTNHKEYFAESTEAYLGVNDFYPFVRAELGEHDPAMFAVLEKIWGPVR
ncbi:MAG TPA: metallopeptidase [Pirellulaceae bacterium]|nr:metallopeptidase [Pirellulaceae bacterium]